MKAILKKMDLIVNLKGFALTLLGVGVLVSSQGLGGRIARRSRVRRRWKNRSRSVRIKTRMPIN